MGAEISNLRSSAPENSSFIGVSLLFFSYCFLKKVVDVFDGIDCD